MGIIQAALTQQAVQAVAQELINQMQDKLLVYPVMDLINIKILQVKQVVKPVEQIVLLIQTTQAVLLRVKQQLIVQAINT